MQQESNLSVRPVRRMRSDGESPGKERDTPGMAFFTVEIKDRIQADFSFSGACRNGE